MSQVPSKTERTYKEPVAVQFSMFLANRVGQLKELMDYLAKEDIEVAGLSIIDSTDWAVIRVVFASNEKAREALKRHQIPFTESEVLLVCLPEPESLAGICDYLLRAEINVHFAYSLMVRHGDFPILVLHVDDLGIAQHVLLRHGMTLLGEGDLANVS